MNEQNLEYLNKQIKFTGFGEAHQDELKQQLQKQLPEFTLFHQQDFGKDNTVAMLQFKKSSESDMYFFNRFELLTKNAQQPEGLKQTFYLNNKEDNITLKEGYNLLNGRSVHKELTSKEGEKYNAWLQLDFKLTDKNGNFEVKKFHQNYGYDLAQTLAKYPIKEMLNETDKTKLMDSLQRGNRQSVTWQQDGKEQKIFIEASPKFKSLNLYDGNSQKINVQSMNEKNGEGQSMNAPVKKEAIKAGKADEESEGPTKSPKKSRKKSQGIS